MPLLRCIRAQKGESRNSLDLSTDESGTNKEEIGFHFDVNDIHLEVYHSADQNIGSVSNVEQFVGALVYHISSFFKHI